jgi:sugar phosphate isomerase/epimerase
MKIAYVLSTHPTRFEAAAFAPDFEVNAARLAALGYDGIELAVRDPALLDVVTVRRVIAAQHLRVPALGTGQAFLEEHLSFTDPDPTVRERAIYRIKSHITLAHELDALIILGLIRGKLQPNVSPDQARAWLLDAMKSVARSASENGVRLAIEPLNRYESNLVNTVADACVLIDEIGMHHVGIVFDTFHANIEEPRLDESLRACGSRLFHVHLADSNRWAPGAGHIDFARIIATLREMKYEGWVSAEVLPEPNIATAAEQMMRTMRPLFE